MADRRALLRSLAALPLAGVALPADPIPALNREAMKLCADVQGVEDDDVADPIMERWSDVELQGIAARPTTLAGAIAALEWTQWEHMRDRMARHPDQGGHLLLAMLDGALDVLRQVAFSEVPL